MKSIVAVFLFNAGIYAMGSPTQGGGVIGIILWIVAAWVSREKKRTLIVQPQSEWLIVRLFRG